MESKTKAWLMIATKSEKLSFIYWFRYFVKSFSIRGEESRKKLLHGMTYTYKTDNTELRATAAQDAYDAIEKFYERRRSTKI